MHSSFSSHPRACQLCLPTPAGDARGVGIPLLPPGLAQPQSIPLSFLPRAGSRLDPQQRRQQVCRAPPPPFPPAITDDVSLRLEKTPPNTNVFSSHNQQLNWERKEILLLSWKYLNAEPSLKKQTWGTAAAAAARSPARERLKNQYPSPNLSNLPRTFIQYN